MRLLAYMFRADRDRVNGLRVVTETQSLLNMSVILSESSLTKDKNLMVCLRRAGD
jgi:hypothetical protein